MGQARRGTGRGRGSGGGHRRTASREGGSAWALPAGACGRPAGAEPLRSAGAGGGPLTATRRLADTRTRVHRPRLPRACRPTHQSGRGPSARRRGCRRPQGTCCCGAEAGARSLVIGSGRAQRWGGLGVGGARRGGAAGPAAQRQTAARRRAASPAVGAVELALVGLEDVALRGTTGPIKLARAGAGGCRTLAARRAHARRQNTSPHPFSPAGPRWSAPRRLPTPPITPPPPTFINC